DSGSRSAMAIFYFGPWTPLPTARSWCASRCLDEAVSGRFRGDLRRGIPFSRRGFTIVWVRRRETSYPQEFSRREPPRPEGVGRSSSEISPCTDDVFRQFCAVFVRPISYRARTPLPLGRV